MIATRMHKLTGATPVDLKALLPRRPADTGRSTDADSHISHRVYLG